MALVGSNFAGLSGAALTSACLAYLGGGAIAAGGAGMLGGTIAIVGGGAALGIGVGAGVGGAVGSAGLLGKKNTIMQSAKLLTSVREIFLNDEHDVEFSNSVYEQYLQNITEVEKGLVELRLKKDVGMKLLRVRHLTLEGQPTGEELIALDAADAGIGDIVLVNNDGGAAQMIMDDTKLIASVTICGVIDSYSWQGQTVHCH